MTNPIEALYAAAQKATPGPWRVEYVSDAGFIIIGKANNRGGWDHVASVPTYSLGTQLAPPSSGWTASREGRAMSEHMEDRIRADADAADERAKPTDAECDGYGGELPNSADGWFCDKCAYTGRWGDNGPHTYKPPEPNIELNASVIRALADVVSAARAHMTKDDVPRTAMDASIWSRFYETRDELRDALAAFDALDKEGEKHG